MFVYLHSAWPLLLALALNTVCVPKTDPYQDTENYQQAPTAKYVHTTGSGHYHFLLWSLATGSGGAVENINSPCSHCEHYIALAKYHTVVDVMDSSGLT